MHFGSAILNLLVTMRPLTEPETQTLFTKLANYTGPSLKALIAPAPSGSAKEDTRMVFRMHQSRVYYCSLHIANLATSIARPNLLSVGTCLGKYNRPSTSASSSNRLSSYH